MVGAVAGGSALIGTVGGVVAAGYLGSTLGLGGTAAAGAAASPQGQQVINTVLNISGTIADSAEGQIILQTGQVGDLAGAIGNATTIAAQTGNQVVLGMGNAIPFANGSVNQVIMNNVPIGSGTSEFYGPWIDPVEVQRILAPGGTVTGASSPIFWNLVGRP